MTFTRVHLKDMRYPKQRYMVCRPIWEEGPKGSVTNKMNDVTCKMCRKMIQSGSWKERWKKKREK